MTPLIEKPPESPQKLPTPPAAIAEPTSGRSEGSPKPNQTGVFQVHVAAAPEEVSNGAPKEGEKGATLGRFNLGGSRNGELAAGPFSSSIKVLTRLRRAGQETDVWIEAARVLKSDAARVRKTMSRHASVLLAMSDALTFTEPDDPTLDFQAGTLSRSIALLTEPFLSEPDEEAFLTDLLEHGWNLVPAADTQPLTA